MAKKGRKWSNIPPGDVPVAPQPELSDREVAVREEVARRRETTYEDPLDGSQLIKPAATMKELAAEYAELVEEEEFADLEAKRRSIKYEALERLILEQLEKIEEATGHDSWRGEGQTFSPQNMILPQVKDKQRLRDYIVESGQEECLTLSGPKLKELVVDRLETLLEMTPAQRAALPPGVTLKTPLPGVEVFIMKVAHRSKS